MLQEKGLSMYRLSKLSGILKTTVIDICSFRSDIENPPAKPFFSWPFLLAVQWRPSCSWSPQHVIQYRSPQGYRLPRTRTAWLSTRRYSSNEEILGHWRSRRTRSSMGWIVLAQAALHDQNRGRYTDAYRSAKSSNTRQLPWFIEAIVLYSSNCFTC